MENLLFYPNPYNLILLNAYFKSCHNIYYLFPWTIIHYSYHYIYCFSINFYYSQMGAQYTEFVDHRYYNLFLIIIIIFTFHTLYELLIFFYLVHHSFVYKWYFFIYFTKKLSFYVRKVYYIFWELLDISQKRLFLELLRIGFSYSLINNLLGFV